MDDQAAVIARRVAMAAAAWFDAPANIDAYSAPGGRGWGVERVLLATHRGSTRPDAAELLDELADAAGPPLQPLGVGLVDLEAVLRSKARRSL